MAKMRGVKPGFFTSDAVAETSIAARLLLIGLFTLACDHGHVENRPKQIKRRILPEDDVNCSELIRELIGTGAVTVDGDWLVITGFREHQRIDIRFFVTCAKEGCVKPEKPPKATESDDVERESRRGHGVGTPGSRDEGEGEGEGEGEMRGLPSVGAPPPVVEPPAAAKAADKTKRGTRLDPTWTPSPALIQQVRDQGIPDDLARRELPKFRDFWTAKTGRNATKLDWDATWRNWLRTAQERQPRGRAPSRVEQNLEVVRQMQAAEQAHRPIPFGELQ